MNSHEIREIYSEYSKIAEQWKNVSDLFNEVGETGKIEYINKASNILVELSEKERIAMVKLEKAVI